MRGYGSCQVVAGLALAALAALAGASPMLAQSPHSTPAPSPYLLVWTGPHASHAGADHAPAPARQAFLAVIDADPSSTTYGRVIATAPAAGAAGMAHHSEYSLVGHGSLFADDFITGRVSVFDVRNPRAPRLARTIDSVPGFRQPHSFARLPNGHVLATLQFGNRSLEGDPGGLAEFDADGRLLRAVSSADPAFPGARIRTYGLEVLPAIDRAITTSTPMDDEATADVIQLWRLSDLKLLRTIAVPTVAGDSLERYPFEIRALADGRSAIMHTYYCGFYRLTDLDTDTPRIDLVLAMRDPVRIGCSVPTLVGRYAVVPIAFAHRIVSLDLSDPAHPVQVSALETDSTTFPHWSSADPSSDRVVITEQGDGEPRVMIVRLDAATGQLTWDAGFADAGSKKRGVSFAAWRWPEGGTGAAMPHGAVFASPPR
jgi:hypothetical protein